MKPEVNPEVDPKAWQDPAASEPAAANFGSESPRSRGIFGGSAWRIARVADIDIAIDQSWLLIFALITFSLSNQFGLEHEGWGATQRWLTAVFASLVFFVSIVLHELGHSLTALRLGVKVRSITLFLFGGVAQMMSQPKRPRDEIGIAIAGPIVSALLGLAFLWLADALAVPGDDPGSAAAALGWLGKINIVLAVFNLVPGFPLDGGRVFRGLVWAATGSFRRATRIAATTGGVFAITLVAFGVMIVFAGQLLGGLWLAFIGWFLLQASRSEAGAVVLERVMRGVSVSDLMSPVDQACVTGDETVADVLAGAVLRRGLRTLYVTTPDRHLKGLVSLRELSAVPTAERASTRLLDVMIPQDRLHALSFRDTGWTAMNAMAQRNVNQIPVVDRGLLQGSVTRERLLNVLNATLQSEIESGAPDE